MPFIKLKRNWFGPDAIRYRASSGKIAVSQEVADVAPSDAIVYDDDGKQVRPALEEAKPAVVPAKK